LDYVFHHCILSAAGITARAQSPYVGMFFIAGVWENVFRPFDQRDWSTTNRKIRTDPSGSHTDIIGSPLKLDLPAGTDHLVERIKLVTVVAKPYAGTAIFLSGGL
jgi:hypothetical protein